MSRLRVPGLTVGVVLTVGVILTVLTFEVDGPISTSAAKGASPTGEVTVTGAIHKTWRLNSAGQCETDGAHTFVLYSNPGHPTSSTNLLITTTGKLPGAGSHPVKVNLASTTTYRVYLDIPYEYAGISSIWIAGLSLGIGAPSSADTGSGTLSLNRTAGKLSARMILSAAHPDPIQVTASWSCPKPTMFPRP